MSPLRKSAMAIAGMVIALGLISCENESEKPAMTDGELYELAKQTVNFRWYKDSGSMDEASEGSEHGLPLYRTRFDEKASTMLDTEGKVKEGSTFPEGSLIVKELYDSTEALAIYAVRYKSSEYSNADAKGWIWGYLNADGSVREPAANAGAMCIDCHSQEGHIEYVLLNLVHK